MTFFSTVLAQVTNPIVKNSTDDGVTYISNFITQMVSIIFVVGSVAFMFMFLLGGIKWITAGGDKGQLENARSQVTQAITGLIVLFGVYAIARLMNTIFGIELIDIDLTPILA